MSPRTKRRRAAAAAPPPMPSVAAIIEQGAPVLLEVGEVKRRLGGGRTALCKAALAPNGIEPTRIGNRRLYRASDLDAWLKARAR